MSKVNLETFAGGALQEKFNMALDKVTRNLKDPNTPWKNKREITIKVSFEQNEERDDISADVSVTEKLAPSKSIRTRMLMEQNLETGEIYVQEYGNQIRGQMSLDDLAQQDAEEGTARDTDAIKKTVVDFRAAKQA